MTRRLSSSRVGMALHARAERHRSRTCLASGYDAVLVLKDCRVGDVSPSRGGEA
jgi:hypothetical protein